MFNIKNIKSTNVALQLQMLSNGINFLCDLEVSNAMIRELDIFMSGKSVSCKNCKNKISKLKFNMAMHSINNLFYIVTWTRQVLLWLPREHVIKHQQNPQHGPEFTS